MSKLSFLNTLWAGFWSSFTLPDPSADYLNRMKSAQKIQGQDPAEMSAHLKSLSIRKNNGELLFLMFKLAMTGFLIVQAVLLLGHGASMVLDVLRAWFISLAPFIGIGLAIFVLIVVWEAAKGSGPSEIFRIFRRKSTGDTSPN